jgi:polysaccharide biosynthesis protein PslG
VRGLGRVAQGTTLVAENPLRVTVLPVTPNSLPVLIENPARDGFDGWVGPARSEGIRFGGPAVAVHLAPGSSDVTVALPLDQRPGSAYQTGLTLVDEDGNVVLEVLPVRFAAIGDFSQYASGVKPLDYRLKASGFELGGSTLEAALPSEGPPEPGMGALKISFKLPPGKDLTTTAPAAISGEPKALGLWIHGDGSGVLPYLSFVDSSGQSFEEGGGPINWKGWRYVLVFMDAPQASHSGGANDGAIHYPIRWESLLTLHNPSSGHMDGVLYLSGPTLIYGPVSDKSPE